MQPTSDLTEEQVEAKILEIHQQRRLAGADDSANSMMLSTLLGLQALFGIEVNEAATQRAAAGLLPMLPCPGDLTEQQLLRSTLEGMTDQEMDNLVEAILSHPDQGGAALGESQTLGKPTPHRGGTS